MTKTSADLWYRPLASYSVVSEDVGAFGTVCEPVGPVAKKSDKCHTNFFYIHILGQNPCTTFVTGPTCLRALENAGPLLLAIPQELLKSRH